MSGPALEAVGLSKRFGSTQAVAGVTFTVGNGEVVGLLGPNGAGKTTTLRMLAGLIAPSTGEARVCGIDVQKDPLAARKKLGFLTASTGLYDRLSAREVLETFGRLQGLEGDALARRIDAVSAELDLGAFIDRRCGTLSSGQKQRVSIARAVVNDPDVYVLDEPTATLDPLASSAILELVQRARQRGKAVLFSTHRMEEAEFLCSRLLFVMSGKIVAEGPPKQLVEQSGQGSLTAAFLALAKA
ncbi:MAG: ABC transporter ATP-binding protein [Myxococcaceae bacterium]